MPLENPDPAFAEAVEISSVRMHAMFTAFIESEGNLFDPEQTSKALVLLALQIREVAQGGLTGADAAWLRIFAESIEGALAREEAISAGRMN